MVALLVKSRLSISWQSKSEEQTEFSGPDPARAVPLRWPGLIFLAVRLKTRISTLTGLTDSFPCQERMISLASLILALMRASSISTRSIEVSGMTRQFQGIAPRWVRQVMMRRTPEALRMNSLCSHPKAGARGPSAPSPGFRQADADRT